MTEINKKLQEIVEQYKIPESKLLFVEDIKQEEIDNWFIEIKKDLINYIHCCTQLKGKEAIPFEEWVEREGYENKWTGFWKEGKSVTYWTVKNRYNTYRNNL